MALPFQPLEPWSYACARDCGDAHDFKTFALAVRVSFRSVDVKLHIRKQVGLGQDKQLSFEENSRVLQWLVIAFGTTEHDNFCSLTKIVARRANEITNIFDQQQIELVVIEIFERTFNHRCFEVTSAARCDVLYRKTEACEPERVIVGLNVSSDHGNASLTRQGFERAFQQCRFPCAGRTDDVKAKYTVLGKVRAQP